MCAKEEVVDGKGEGTLVQGENETSTKYQVDQEGKHVDMVRVEVTPSIKSEKNKKLSTWGSTGTLSRGEYAVGNEVEVTNTCEGVTRQLVNPNHCMAGTAVCEQENVPLLMSLEMPVWTEVNALVSCQTEVRGALTHII